MACQTNSSADGELTLPLLFSSRACRSKPPHLSPPQTLSPPCPTSLPCYLLRPNVGLLIEALQVMHSEGTGPSGKKGVRGLSQAERGHFCRRKQNPYPPLARRAGKLPSRGLQRPYTPCLPGHLSDAQTTHVSTHFVSTYDVLGIGEVLYINS